jgi:hypothetical protein
MNRKTMPIWIAFMNAESPLVLTIVVEIESTILSKISNYERLFPSEGIVL